MFRLLLSPLGNGVLPWSDLSEPRNPARAQNLRPPQDFPYGSCPLNTKASMQGAGRFKNGAGRGRFSPGALGALGAIGRFRFF